MSISTLHVVIGPTASGKSEYAVTLASQLNGEIISADSRQVYRGLDIGSGKVEGAWKPVPSNELRVTRKREDATPQNQSNLTSKKKTLSNLSLHRQAPSNLSLQRQAFSNLSLRGSFVTKQSTEPPSQKSSRLNVFTSEENWKLKIENSLYVYKNIPHHCIDFVDPNYQYTVADFKRDAEQAIADIVARGKTPILCGGTGQYIDAIVFSQTLPEAKPNPKLRKELETKSIEELFALLQSQDPERAANIDPHNPRRLIRALEIIHETGKPVPPSAKGNPFAAKGLPFVPVIHYLNPPRAELYAKIETRLRERVVQGMLEEVAQLHAQGVSWERMEDFGLEYRYTSRFLQAQSIASPPRIGGIGGGRSHQENQPAEAISQLFLDSAFFQELLTQIKHYAKRQQTWFKKYEPAEKI